MHSFGIGCSYPLRQPNNNYLTTEEEFLSSSNYIFDVVIKQQHVHHYLTNLFITFSLKDLHWKTDYYTI